MNEIIQQSAYSFNVDNVLSKYFKHFNKWQLDSSPEKIQDYYINKSAKDKVEYEKSISPFLCFPREVWDLEKNYLGVRQSLVFPKISAWSKITAKEYTKLLQNSDDKILKIFSKINCNSQKLSVLCNESEYTNIGQNIVHIAWRPSLSSDSQILACLVALDNLSKSNEVNVLQIWDYGILNNDSSKPVLKYSQILDWGKIIKMLWISPDKVDKDIVTGCRYAGNQFELPQNLYGHMLFVCANGKLKIIPIAEFLDSELSSLNLSSPEPNQFDVLQIAPTNVMKLGISTSHINDTKVRFGCPICADWKSKFPTKILVGFSKGYVAIFDLSIAHHTRYDHVNNYLSPIYKKRLSHSAITCVAISPIDWQQFNVTVAPNPEGTTNFNVNISSNFRPIDVIKSTKPLWTVIWPSRADILIAVPISRNKVIIKSILSEDTATVQVNKITSICVCDIFNSIIVTTECGSLVNISLSDQSVIKSLFGLDDSIDLSKASTHIRSYRYFIDKNNNNNKSFIDIKCKADLVSLYDSHDKIEYPQISSMSVNPNMVSQGRVAVGFENGIIHTTRCSNRDALSLIKTIIDFYEMQACLNIPQLKTKKVSNVRKVNRVPNSDKKKSKSKAEIKTKNSPDYDPLDNILYSTQNHLKSSNLSNDSSKDISYKNRKNQTSKENSKKSKKKSTKSSVRKIYDSDSDEISTRNSPVLDFATYCDEICKGVDKFHVDKEYVNSESGNTSSTENMVDESCFFDSEVYNDTNSSPKIPVDQTNNQESSNESGSVKPDENQLDLSQNLIISPSLQLDSTIQCKQINLPDTIPSEFSNLEIGSSTNVQDDFDFTAGICNVEKNEKSSPIIKGFGSEIPIEQVINSSIPFKPSLGNVNIDSCKVPPTISIGHEVPNGSIVDGNKSEQPCESVSNSDFFKGALDTLVMGGLESFIEIDNFLSEELTEINPNIDIKSESVNRVDIIQDMNRICDTDEYTIVDEIVMVVDEADRSNHGNFQSMEIEESSENIIDLETEQKIGDSQIVVGNEANCSNEENLKSMKSKESVEILIDENYINLKTQEKIGDSQIDTENEDICLISAKLQFLESEKLKILISENIDLEIGQKIGDSQIVIGNEANLNDENLKSMKSEESSEILIDQNYMDLKTHEKIGDSQIATDNEDICLNKAKLELLESEKSKILNSEINIDLEFSKVPVDSQIVIGNEINCSNDESFESLKLEESGEILIDENYIDLKSEEEVIDYRIFTVNENSRLNDENHESLKSEKSSAILISEKDIDLQKNKISIDHQNVLVNDANYLNNVKGESLKSELSSAILTIENNIELRTEEKIGDSQIIMENATNCSNDENLLPFGSEISKEILTNESDIDLNAQNEIIDSPVLMEDAYCGNREIFQSVKSEIPSEILNIENIRNLTTQEHFVESTMSSLENETQKENTNSERNIGENNLIPNIEFISDEKNIPSSVDIKSLATSSDLSKEVEFVGKSSNIASQEMEIDSAVIEAPFCVSLDESSLSVFDSKDKIQIIFDESDLNVEYDFKTSENDSTNSQLSSSPEIEMTQPNEVLIVRENPESQLNSSEINDLKSVPNQFHLNPLCESDNLTVSEAINSSIDNLGKDSALGDNYSKVNSANIITSGFEMISKNEIDIYERSMVQNECANDIIILHQLEDIKSLEQDNIGIVENACNLSPTQSLCVPQFFIEFADDLQLNDAICDPIYSKSIEQNLIHNIDLTNDDISIISLDYGNFSQLNPTNNEGNKTESKHNTMKIKPTTKNKKIESEYQNLELNKTGPFSTNFQDVIMKFVSETEVKDTVIDVDEVNPKRKSAGNIFQILSELQMQIPVPAKKTKITKECNLESRLSSNEISAFVPMGIDRCIGDSKKLLAASLPIAIVEDKIDNTSSSNYQGNTSNIIRIEKASNSNIFAKFETSYDKVDHDCEIIYNNIYEIEDSNICEIEDSNICEMKDSNICEMKDSNICEMKDSNICEMKDSNICEIKDSNVCEIEDNNICEIKDSNICEIKDSNIFEIKDNICEIEDNNIFEIKDSNICEIKDSNICEIKDSNVCEIEDNNICEIKDSNICEIKDSNICEIKDSNICEIKDSNICEMKDSNVCEIEDNNICEIKDSNICEIKDSNIFEIKDNICEIEDNNIFEIKDSNICEIKDSNICEIKDSNVCEIEDNNICEIKDSNICEIKDSNICEIKNNNVCEIEDNNICEIKDSNICEIKDSNICEIKDSNICEIKDSNICEMKDSNICEIKDSNICETNDSNICETKDNNVCEIEDNNICELKDSNICELKDSNICEINGNNVCEINGNNVCEIKYSNICEIEDNNICEIKNSKSFEIEDNSILSANENNTSETKHNNIFEVMNNNIFEETGSSICELEDCNASDMKHNNICESKNNNFIEIRDSNANEIKDSNICEVNNSNTSEIKDSDASGREDGVICKIEESNSFEKKDSDDCKIDESNANEIEGSNICEIKDSNDCKIEKNNAIEIEDSHNCEITDGKANEIKDTNVNISSLETKIFLNTANENELLKVDFIGRHGTSTQEIKDIKCISEIEKSDIYENVGLINIGKSNFDNKTKIDRKIVENPSIEKCPDIKIEIKEIQKPIHLFKMDSPIKISKKDKNDTPNASTKLLKNKDNDKNFDLPKLSSKREIQSKIVQKNSKQIDKIITENTIKEKNNIVEVSVKSNEKKESKKSNDKKRKLDESSFEVKVKKSKCDNYYPTEEKSILENIPIKITRSRLAMANSDNCDLDKSNRNTQSLETSRLLNPSRKLRTINEFKKDSVKLQDIEYPGSSSVAVKSIRKLDTSEYKNIKRMKMDESEGKEITRKSARLIKRDNICDVNIENKNQKNDSSSVQSVSNSTNSEDSSSRQKRYLSKSRKINQENWWNNSIITIEWQDEKYIGGFQRIKGCLLDGEPVVGKITLVHWPKILSKVYPAIVREIFIE